MGVTNNHILIIVIHKLVVYLQLTYVSVDVHSENLRNTVHHQQRQCTCKRHSVAILQAPS